MANREGFPTCIAWGALRRAVTGGGYGVCMFFKTSPDSPQTPWALPPGSGARGEGIDAFQTLRVVWGGHSNTPDRWSPVLPRRPAGGRRTHCNAYVTCQTGLPMVYDIWEVGLHSHVARRTLFPVECRSKASLWACRMFLHPSGACV